MTSLIIKDIKYHILRSLSLVIIELLPQTLDSVRALFPNFLVTFFGNAPPFLFECLINWLISSVSWLLFK